MASDVLMPRLSDSMEEGTVLKWLVEQGGEVKRGAALVEIETDKANMTYEADTDGALVEIVAQEGDTLAVGEVIARVGEEGEAPGGGDSAESAEESAGGDAEEDGDEGGDAGEGDDADDVEAASAEGGDREEGDGDVSAETSSTSVEQRGSGRAETGANGAGERIKASPVARRMAGELGVELARLEGSGPGGRIVKADVEAAAQDGAPSGDGGEPEGAEASVGADGAAKPAAAKEHAPAAAPADTGEHGPKGAPEVVELTRLQRTVSRRMAESKATAPDFSLQIDVDMSGCVELRGRLKQESDTAPSYNDMVVKAAALALREHPKVNGAYRDGAFELYPRINVGVAVAAQGTLVVPVVRDADQVSLGEVSRRSRALIGKVRDGEITPPELSGATFTVSNLGMFGIDRFSAIINPPQAAILSVGSLAKRPAVDDRGRVVARDTMNLTLTCDHRILYGADGAEFLAHVRELLQSPLSLAL